MSSSLQINPFFSIIIPTYNRANLIKSTIESVLAQSFRSFELIVVDDGSTDNTQAVVASMAHPQLKYFYQPNQERSAARNNGAKWSSGQYLLFLDSDDYFKPNHLQRLYQSIAEKEFPIALFLSNCTYQLVDENGTKEEPAPELPFEKYSPFEFLLFYPITPSRACVHRVIFKEHQFDLEINIGEDQLLWLKIAAHYPVHYLNLNTVVYTIHTGNSVSLAKNPYIARLSALKKLFFHPQYSDVQQKVKAKHRNYIMAECYFNIARAHIFLREPRKALKALWHSFRLRQNYRNKERLYMVYTSLKQV